MKTGPRPCGFQLPPSRRVAGITSSCSAATNGTSGPRRRFNAGQLRAGLFTPSSCGGSQLLLNQRFQPIPGAINRHPAERPKRHVQSSWKLTVHTQPWRGERSCSHVFISSRYTVQTSAQSIHRTKGAFVAVGLFIIYSRTEFFFKNIPSCIRSRRRGSGIYWSSVCFQYSGSL